MRCSSGAQISSLRAALWPAPYHHRFGLTQPQQRVGAAQLQPIVGGHQGDKVIALRMADKGIGPLFEKGGSARVWSFRFSRLGDGAVALIHIMQLVEVGAVRGEIVLNSVYQRPVDLQQTHHARGNQIADAGDHGKQQPNTVDRL
ncbi:hypothetical protein EIO60_01857|nr:hypothetical protein [Candidatus Pantoea persica]